MACIGALILVLVAVGPTVLLGGVTVFWLTTLGLSFVETHHEIDELFDAQLVQTSDPITTRSRSKK